MEGRCDGGRGDPAGLLKIAAPEGMRGACKTMTEAVVPLTCAKFETLPFFILTQYVEVIPKNTKWLIFKD